MATGTPQMDATFLEKVGDTLTSVSEGFVGFLTRHGLALIGDVLLHSRHATVLAPQIRGRHPEGRDQIPVGLVEFANVPHDVHVAHVIALPGVDAALVRCQLQGTNSLRTGRLPRGVLAYRPVVIMSRFGYARRVQFPRLRTYDG